MVISDIKVRAIDCISPPCTTIVAADYYEADVKQAVDQYPFGWDMPGRTFWGNDEYRYSTNGTEKSPEIASGHNSTYFRELDSRTGRWWAVDPVTHPHQSPYCTFDNNPVVHADPSGAATGTGGSTSGAKQQGNYSAPKVSDYMQSVNATSDRIAEISNQVKSEPPSTHLEKDGNIAAAYNDGEYEKNKETGEWEKVSNIGDEMGIDFYHEDIVTTEGKAKQVTKIVDKEGNENYMNDGRKWLQGGKIRDKDVNWNDIYSEWRWGNGPETSIFEGDHPSNELIKESKWLQEQIYEFGKSGKPKDNAGFDWDSGIRAWWNGNSGNMQLTMMGSYSVSFYRFGESNNLLVFIIDDKTRDSGVGGRLGIPNYSRSEGMPLIIDVYPQIQPKTKMMTTTKQRSLFVVGKLPKGANGGW